MIIKNINLVENLKNISIKEVEESYIMLGAFCEPQS